MKECQRLSPTSTPTADPFSAVRPARTWNRSHVLVPSPLGDLRVVIFSFFVGSLCAEKIRQLPLVGFPFALHTSFTIMISRDSPLNYENRYFLLSNFLQPLSFFPPSLLSLPLPPLLPNRPSNLQVLAMINSSSLQCLANLFQVLHVQRGERDADAVDLMTMKGDGENSMR